MQGTREQHDGKWQYGHLSKFALVSLNALNFYACKAYYPRLTFLEAIKQFLFFD